MNYEEEAKQFWITPMDETISGTADWLRQHDARLLSALAADLSIWQVHGNTFCGHIRYIERRAREIESKIGEKP